jgi:signal transduction histidine kinase
MPRSLGISHHCAREAIRFDEVCRMAGIRTLLFVLLVIGGGVWSDAHGAEQTPVNPEAEITAKISEARQLHLSDSTKSRLLAEEALARARQHSLPRHEAAALVELAIALRRQNQNGAALHHMRDALLRVEALDDRALLKRTMKEAGHTYWAAGDNATATDYFQRALILAEQDNDLAGQSDAHAGLAVAASGLRDRVRSREHTARALALAEQLKDEARIAMYGSNFGNYLLREGDTEGARNQYARALAIFEKLGRRTDAADSKADLARVASREGNFDEAERLLREILPSRRRLRGKIKLTSTLVLLAEALRGKGQLDEALSVLNEASMHAADLARASKLLVLEELVLLHEARKDYPAALRALREVNETAAASYGEAAQARAAEVREAFEAQRREAEIARLREAETLRTSELRAKEAELGRQAAELRARTAEIERARASRYALAGSLGAGLVALGALVAFLRLRLTTERRIHAETRAAKESAEHADRIKTRFLGIASHDIRGPLGNIVNLTSELRHDAAGTEAERERFDLIGSEAQRVINLVEDLITTAALEAGKLELRVSRVDLTEVVRTAIGSLRWQADAKRQTIAFLPPLGDVGMVQADPARLQQVVANLVGNAIKFSPPGETISLQLRRRGAVVELAVHDRGAGIAEEDIPRLFTPFERLATQPTAGESSHGLGLSIAQEIARRHGGKIRVESKLGEGATFTLELPA